MDIVVYKNELEHMNEKLIAAKAIRDKANNKDDLNVLKGIISSLEKEIQVAEDNDPTIRKERERVANEEKRKKDRELEEKRAKRALLKKNSKSILIGSIIIVVVIGACILSAYNAQMSQSYVSGLRMGVGMMLLFASFILVPLGKVLTGSFSGPIGGIAIGFGGILMGIGSTVSSDARNGSAEGVIFGMMLICFGTLIYIFGYWANRFGKK